MPDSSLRDICFIAEYVASFLYRPEKARGGGIVNVTDIPILFQPYWYNSLTFWTDLARRHDCSNSQVLCQGVVEEYCAHART